MIHKYVLTLPRAPGPVPAEPTPKAGDSPRAVGRGARVKKEERKGSSSFLETWLKSGGGHRKQGQPQREPEG